MSNHISFTISEFIFKNYREIRFTNSERGIAMGFKNDVELYGTIGMNIKRRREFAKLTQVQLADAAQLSTSYISKIEAAGCDKSLSIAALNQVANALNVEITEFFRKG